MKKYSLILILLYFVSSINAQWFIQNPGMNFGQIRDTHFIDENTGWLLVDYNKIYNTINGGENWVCIDTLTNFIDAFFFIDSIHGWGTGNNKIIHTQNGGNSWSLQFESNDPFFGQQYRDIFFIDENHGWVVGYDTVLITSNGGGLWQAVDIDLWLPRSVFFINHNVGWIAGGEGKIIKTTDGGFTWALKPTSSDGELKDIIFTDQNNGWAAGREFVGGGGQSIILRSLDGGENWDLTQLPGGQTLYSISFPDSVNGWVCGSYGTIWHTNDAGNSWELQSTPTNNYLYTIDFVNQNTGWATGLYSTIISTENGGIVGIDLNTTSNINEIKIFPNPTTDIIHIETEEKTKCIQLFNMFGECVINESLQSKIDINISNLTDGLYIIRVHFENHTYSEKIVIQ